ncbi:MAG TPA: hypothetical protein PKV43_11160, partial [Armatimonadota bacterium]|nr:hypothetical protein [Armatimonadota bacterium]
YSVYYFFSDFCLSQFNLPPSQKSSLEFLYLSGTDETLGRWLMATMFEYVQCERPEVVYYIVPLTAGYHPEQAVFVGIIQSWL